MTNPRNSPPPGCFSLAPDALRDIRAKVRGSDALTNTEAWALLRHLDRVQVEADENLVHLVAARGAYDALLLSSTGGFPQALRRLGETLGVVKP
jgi:hypothetical protein